MLLHIVLFFVYKGLYVRLFPIQIPFHRFQNSAFEILVGTPAKFLLNFCGVNGVTTVVTGTVFYEGNQLFIRFAIGARTLVVENGADGIDNLQIGALVAAANVIGLSRVRSP